MMKKIEFAAAGGVTPPEKLDGPYIKHTLAGILLSVRDNASFLLNPGEAAKQENFEAEVEQAREEILQQLARLHSFLRHVDATYLEPNRVASAVITTRMEQIKKWATRLQVCSEEGTFSAPKITDISVLRTLHDTCVDLSSWYKGNMDTLPPDVGGEKEVNTPKGRS